MIVKRHEIVQAIRELWPDLVDGHTKPGNIFIPRREYFAPSQKQFQTFVSQDWTEVIQAIHYDINRWACSNFSAAFSVQADLYVLWQVAQNKFEESASREWAVMEVWGYRGIK